MTVNEVIQRADGVKPNPFTTQEKFNWVNELNQRVGLELMLMTPKTVEQICKVYPDDLDTKLLIRPPNDELYVLYLMSRIDEMSGEYNKYANSSAIFNQRWGQFAEWFLQFYDPAQGYLRKTYPDGEGVENNGTV